MCVNRSVPRGSWSGSGADFPIILAASPAARQCRSSTSPSLHLLQLGGYKLTFFFLAAKNGAFVKTFFRESQLWNVSLVKSLLCWTPSLVGFFLQFYYWTITADRTCRSSARHCRFGLGGFFFCIWKIQSSSVKSTSGSSAFWLAWMSFCIKFKLSAAL